VIPFGEWGDGCGSRGSALLGMVNPIQVDAFSAVVVQDFNSVGVQKPNYLTSKVFWENLL